MYPRKITGNVVCTYDYPVVETNQGKIRGIDMAGVFTFRGIPYAVAERFDMPKKPAKWGGICNAIAYGPVCYELEKRAYDGLQTNPSFSFIAEENCQNLNIWTSTLNKDAKQPVIVWLHGGGWFGCSAMDQYMYDGENLARYEKVTFVSVNHRLNCFGYLDLSAFGAKYEKSSLVGFADLIASLKWIKENIYLFGGDPECVTVMGQSGGVYKVLSLLQSPEADGLFHRAVINSGGTNYLTPPHGISLRAVTQRMGILTANELGLERSNIDEIRHVPVVRLINAVNKALIDFQNEFGIKYRWEPIADGQYLLPPPVVAGFREKSIHIPMLIGNTFGEEMSNYFSDFLIGGKNGWTISETEDNIQKRFGSAAKEMTEAFRKAYNWKNLADLTYIDVKVRPCLTELSKMRASAGGKVFNWLLTFESPWKGGVVSWHTAELPFFFHNAEYLAETSVPEITDLLQKQICSSFVAFARNGDPNCSMVPHWPEVTSDKMSTMIFDSKCRVLQEHDQMLQKVIKKYGLK